MNSDDMIKTIELQTNYILGLIELLLSKKARSIEVRSDVFDEYNEKVDAAHAKMVWTHEGTENWYRNARGRVVAITPWRNDDFWRMTRTVSEADYRIDGAVVET